MGLSRRGLTHTLDALNIFWKTKAAQQKTQNGSRLFGLTLIAEKTNHTTHKRPHWTRSGYLLKQQGYLDPLSSTQDVAYTFTGH